MIASYPVGKNQNQMKTLSTGKNMKKLASLDTVNEFKTAQSFRRNFGSIYQVWNPQIQ